MLPKYLTLYQSIKDKFNFKSIQQYKNYFETKNSAIFLIEMLKSSSSSQQQICAIYVGKKSLTLNALSTHEYAEAVELYNILTECTRIFLRKAALSPQQTISEYLSQCNKGQHVLLKAFSSFNKLSINRICFLQNFIKIFELENHQRNGLDYYQLFRLLCSDFPKDIVVKSVNLVIDKNDGNIENNMAIILNSRKFINALYINFIHTEYLDSLYSQVFEGKNLTVPIVVLAEWVYQKQKNMYKIHEKPLFSAVIQSLLNQIRKKKLINEISTNFNFASSKDSNRKIIFVSQKNCLDFIRSQCLSSKSIKKSKVAQTKFKDSSDEQKDQFSQKKQLKVLQQTNESHTRISYEEFLRQIINQVQYHKWIKENLQMFQNSIIWAVQTYKILSAKEVGDLQPLNQKKIKKK